jgi:hypothetical protein
MSMKTINWMAAALAVAALAVGTTAARAQDKAASAASAPAKAGAQRTFATPEEAAAALATAVRSADPKAMIEVIGPAAKKWLSSGDKVADTADWKNFLVAYDKKHAIDRKGDDRAMLDVGDSAWPFPAPLVKKADRWMFDAEAGGEEIINRRVGRNELDTIKTMQAIVDAQREYAFNDADHNGITAYAARFLSSPGKKDGLYWQTKAGDAPSPLGPLVVQAVREGYSHGLKSAGPPQPYHGYYFRMLTAQGKDAPGGAYDYMVKGMMFGGFAVVAWPAAYGSSGVKTFIVNHDGVVYEADLGDATASEAAKMKLFNPGKGWAAVK